MCGMVIVGLDGGGVGSGEGDAIEAVEIMCSI